MPPSLNSEYPASVGVALIVAGVLLVGFCIGLLYVQPRPEYLTRDLATLGGIALGVLMVLGGAQGSDRRGDSK